MPEQLTKYPDVTLQVLRSAGARCGDAAPPEILKHCPPERFCKLPGGELCVYGLPEAARMTQVSAAEWQALVPAPAPAPSPAPATTGEPGLTGAALGLLAGLLLGWALARRRSRR